MKETVERYKNGDSFAKDILLEEILELHSYSITKQEAEILLYKKYGTS